MTNVIQHPSSPLVAEDRLRTALLEPSRGLLSELLDDAVVLVEADGSVCNKRAVVMEQMKALVRFHTFDVIERGVQVWADTAVVVSRVRRVALVSMGNGALEALADDVRYTRVWRTVGGVWRLFASQATRVQRPDADAQT